MKEKLDLKAKNEKLYVPEEAKIVRKEKFTDNATFIELEIVNGRSLGHVPGQFVQVYLPGIGEAPISISSAPASHNRFDLCFNAVGELTNNLRDKNVGDIIHFRGPFGHGYDDARMKSMDGKHLVFIAGGIGYAPLRSLINKVVPDSKKYKKISILYGAKSPKDRLYTKELENLAKIGGNVELLETVDCADEKWTCGVGVITTLVPKIELNPVDTVVAICGPPVMYKFVLIALKQRDIPKENIYMSLERRMKCGVGKCGHCQMGGIYVCQEGSVFNYAEIEHNEEAI